MLHNIPSSFTLYSSEINVVFDNERMKQMKCLGLCESDHNKITLCDESDGEKLPLDAILDTYYHEKVHMILFYMNEEKLGYNEKFVDTFAKLLRQSEETTEFTIAPLA